MNAPRAEVHALILAAGASRRFGAAKQLARIDGEPLLVRVARRAAAAADRSWVILGAHANELAPLLAHAPVTVRINARWSEGLASSIRAGIQYLPPSCDAVMLVLADQALISTREYAGLAQAWRDAPHSIAAAGHGPRSGAPAIFPRRLFAELGHLHGDVGARSLLEHHASEVLTVPMPSAAFDLDTPDDLASLVNSTIG